jgi:glycosyltransferase involved in cell wall biosynthesis
VLNEEKDLPPSIAALHRFLSSDLGRYEWRITIADNGSTDSTPEVASRLASDYDRVGYLRLDKKGRGRALRKAWLESAADILAYMDVDLSTDLGAFPKLVGAIDTDGYDLAVASRLTKGARVIGRPLHREAISRAYSLIVRGMFLSSLRDYQCGFKAIRQKAARDLVPLVQDAGWFFDSELLLLAGANGYRTKEIPVKWTDDPDSRVRIASTAYGDMRGLLRLRLGGLRRASRLLDERARAG